MLASWNESEGPHLWVLMQENSWRFLLEFEKDWQLSFSGRLSGPWLFFGEGFSSLIESSCLILVHSCWLFLQNSGFCRSLSIYSTLFCLPAQRVPRGPCALRGWPHRPDPWSRPGLVYALFVKPRMCAWFPCPGRTGIFFLFLSLRPLTLSYQHGQRSPLPWGPMDLSPAYHWSQWPSVTLILHLLLQKAGPQSRLGTGSS